MCEAGVSAAEVKFIKLGLIIWKFNSAGLGLTMKVRCGKEARTGFCSLGVFTFVKVVSICFNIIFIKY